MWISFKKVSRILHMYFQHPSMKQTFKDPEPLKTPVDKLVFSREQKDIVKLWKSLDEKVSLHNILFLSKDFSLWGVFWNLKLELITQFMKHRHLLNCLITWATSMNYFIHFSDFIWFEICLRLYRYTVILAQALKVILLWIHTISYAVIKQVQLVMTKYYITYRQLLWKAF